MSEPLSTGPEDTAGPTLAQSSSTLAKNIGLAHLHFLKTEGKPDTATCLAGKVSDNKDIVCSDPLGYLEPASEQASHPFHDLFEQQEDEGLVVLQWSMKRFMLAWGTFLGRPHAQQDPQYGNIRQIYETMRTMTSKMNV